MSAPLTPEQRTQRARLAAHASWANTSDPKARTANARAGFRKRFEREVDPDGVLTPEERERRAEYAMKAYMARLAFLSSRAKQRRRRAS